MGRFTESKKARKKAQIKKNRFQEEIFQALRLRRAEEERVKELEKGLKPKPAVKSPEAWEDKVAVIRNRLTGKKRTSKERWNRFAGTGGEGGRGL